jgi:predicted ester cyclase
MGIPSTRKAFEIGAIALFRAVDGKIVEVRGQFDQLGMMRQLGVIL